MKRKMVLCPSIGTSILKKENTSLTLYMHNLSLKVVLIDDDDKN